jgi:hypothetical protein
MRTWKVAAALLGAAVLLAAPLVPPTPSLAQTPSHPSTPPPQPLPHPPPRPPTVPDKAQPQEHSATDWPLQESRWEAERSARIDSVLACSERVLELARKMNTQMDHLGTPRTFQNLGLRFEQLDLDLYAIVRHLRALHEQRDDQDFLDEIGPHRLLVAYDVLDGIERVLKETERLQWTLERTVLP